MFKYDKNFISKMATEYGFVRDTLEKVYRLADILEYINSEPLLKDKLALKGGTAINFTIFRLPRLSVDIDLDYLIDDNRDEMLKNREIINSTLKTYMKLGGYLLSPQSKYSHSLDSWIYEYLNFGGNKDKIKLEINYSLRAHIFPPQDRQIIAEPFINEYKLKCLNPIEIFGSKINALLNRAAARDLFDVFNMISFGLFDKTEEQLLKKCVVFYSAIAAKDIKKTFNTIAIDNLSKYRIKTELIPVLTKRGLFDLEIAKNVVKNYISNLMTLTHSEQEFLTHFAAKKYYPQSLFDDTEILKRIEKHPMVLWKIRQQ